MDHNNNKKKEYGNLIDLDLDVMFNSHTHKHTHVAYIQKSDNQHS